MLLDVLVKVLDSFPLGSDPLLRSEVMCFAASIGFFKSGKNIVLHNRSLLLGEHAFFNKLLLKLGYHWFHLIDLLVH